ncbi:hypothetical protein Leryth_002658 [Lithospermum erythrorhizon]|nr:hypothetical protein Leryth_002658 [Lithospermum erythrorhizon]
MRISWGKVRLEPLTLFNRRSPKSDKVNNHDESNNKVCRDEEKKEEKKLGQEPRGDASAEPSSSSTSSGEDTTISISEGNSEEQFFSVGDKLLFSLSSISISRDELRCLGIESNKAADEFPITQVHEDESEGEMVSSRTSTSDSEASSQEKRDKFIDLIKKIKKGPTTSLQKTIHQTLPTLNSFKKSFIKKHSRRSTRDERKSMPNIPTQGGPESDIFYCFESTWKNFTLSELKEATDNFSEENLIGEGGYSTIYKGTLDQGQLVAVKKLRGSQEETTSDYLSELGILVHVNHPNVANVIGYGVEDGMHLVLPLSPYGSLETMLKGQEKLSWSCRYKIALGAAFGIAYLHEGCQRRIIHRDIKSANILLTENFEAQICDFGLAKWLPEQWTHLTVTQYEGTFGYLPPEYFLHGIVDEKTDVYSYGVVLLEIISGRPAIDESHNSVVMWAKPLLINKDIEKLIDPSLANSYDPEQLNRMIMVAALCIHQMPSERPQMSKVATMLQGEEGILQSKGKFQRRPPILKRSSNLETNNKRVKSLDLDS